MRQLTTVLLLIMFSSIASARDKAEIATDLIYNEGRALTWLRADYTRNMVRVYGDTFRTKKIVSHIIKKYETEIQETLHEFYLVTFNKKELLVLSTPFSWVNKNILHKVLRARNTPQIIAYAPSLFGQIAYEITSTLDIRQTPSTARWNSGNSIASTETD